MPKIQPRSNDQAQGQTSNSTGGATQAILIILAVLVAVAILVGLAVGLPRIISRYRSRRRTRSKYRANDTNDDSNDHDKFLSGRDPGDEDTWGIHNKVDTLLPRGLSSPYDPVPTPPYLQRAKIRDDDTPSLDLNEHLDSFDLASPASRPAFNEYHPVGRDSVFDQVPLNARGDAETSQIQESSANSAASSSRPLCRTDAPFLRKPAPTTEDETWKNVSPVSTKRGRMVGDPITRPVSPVFAYGD